MAQAGIILAGGCAGTRKSITRDRQQERSMSHRQVELMWDQPGLSLVLFYAVGPDTKSVRRSARSEFVAPEEGAPRIGSPRERFAGATFDAVRRTISRTAFFCSKRRPAPHPDSRSGGLLTASSGHERRYVSAKVTRSRYCSPGLSLAASSHY